MNSPTLKQLAAFGWVAGNCVDRAPLDAFELPMALGVLRERGAIVGSSPVDMAPTVEGFAWAAETLAPIASLIESAPFAARLAAAGRRYRPVGCAA